MTALSADDDGEPQLDSSDEALCEMLGLHSIDQVADEDDVEHGDATRWPQCRHTEEWKNAIQMKSCLVKDYASRSIIVLPKSVARIDATFIRRLTEELVWGKEVEADRTYETIKVLKEGVVEDRRVLTRLEDFVRHHAEWKELCCHYLQTVLSLALEKPMVLYKEKLNLKPPGGSGFAPHLDTPSLRVALGPEGPQTFCTVMVAIDNMSKANGCLRVCKGAWTEEEHISVEEPEEGGNPDGGGRAGAISVEVAETLEFEDIECEAGDIVAFNGWLPHRSKANSSPFPRRAVFLTYNAADEGDFHARYYERMAELRRQWRERIGLETLDAQRELEALNTIPKI
mmetsp:Transcript_18416/g.27365  ORF Transcript_18416/g.27365 Transcript_18416/m.27365 type:complete len:342 (-) Transcript_18416:516-1541(-)|eukprot:CAMPEP_0194056526 /NCGR_PEP_ID=MMETSP0009_2-20130614/60453_1 /TAXON_ID=210454 /ORGANISM="Grammatophora oceanica, Strain CCMP 410" /LENGTH=341 /DNA_ID=CAMNT_0038705933 /DNA_START=30 /DNA_END=1055 /DNA_ORIENTATION=+